MKNNHLYLLPISISEHKNDWISESYKDTVSNCSVFFVENIRTARRFISSLKIGIAIDNLRFVEIGKHAAVSEISAAMRQLEDGANAAVMSESGCPGVADPGSLVVQLAHELGIPIIPLVGPSSIILALMASGLNGQSFAFHGYIPQNMADRKVALKKLETESKRENRTQIFIETPFRNQQLFQSTLDILQPETRLCIALDITGEKEWIRMQKVKDWRKQYEQDWPKLPAIFLMQA